MFSTIEVDCRYHFKNPGDIVFVIGNDNLIVGVVVIEIVWVILLL